VNAGADALCAINTVGPGYFSAYGSAVLSNEMGGMSGKGVLPIALKCVREIVREVDVPVIGCGGLSSAMDVEAMADAGASIFGVGSALVGMTSVQISEYFSALGKDLSTRGKQAESLVQYDVDMDFTPVTLVSNEKVTDDISILTFDHKINVQPGEFIFLWVPGVGEKPFSALTDNPFSLVVIDLGEFTHHLMGMQPGAQAYVRGPHGIPAQPPEDAQIIAVAGGTGLAAVYQLARDFGNADIFVGARSADRLYFQEACAQAARLHVATDDGSAGFHGLVTQLLDNHLSGLSQQALDNLVFYNCGPEPMVHAAVAVQQKYCRAGQIFSAIDYLTKCGVGICGACATPDGRRLCVDGPFLSVDAAAK
jgi:dihydroorotate dehydrogenase (NAD+) catalytic subunit